MVGSGSSGSGWGEIASIGSSSASLVGISCMGSS